MGVKVCGECEHMRRKTLYVYGGRTAVRPVCGWAWDHLAFTVMVGRAQECRKDDWDIQTLKEGS